MDKSNRIVTIFSMIMLVIAVAFLFMAITIPTEEVGTFSKVVLWLLAACYVYGACGVVVIFKVAVKRGWYRKGETG